MVWSSSFGLRFLRITPKKERTKLVLFGLNQKIYYDHITGDQLFIVKHFRNFCFFFITSVILLHSAYLNGLITFDFIFDGLLFVYLIVFSNVMLYGVWRRFIYRNANPILDQLMSTFDAIFSFMDVHEVEASGRRIIERGSEAANRGVFSIQQYSDIVKYMANGDTKSGDTLLIMILKAPKSELPYGYIDD